MGSTPDAGSGVQISLSYPAHPCDLLSGRGGIGKMSKINCALGSSLGSIAITLGSLRQHAQSLRMKSGGL